MKQNELNTKAIGNFAGGLFWLKTGRLAFARYLHVMAISGAFLLLTVMFFTVHAEEMSPFWSSFSAGCKAKLLKNMIIEYNSFSQKNADTVAPEIEAKIKRIIEPFDRFCDCSAEKEQLSPSPECKPSPEESRKMKDDLGKLYIKQPPTVQVLKSKRDSFVIDAPVVTGQLSLFASTVPPPQDLPKIVVLAPGTGSACGRNEVCLGKNGLQFEQAAALLNNNLGIFGKDGTESLQALINDFGADMPVVTSGHNFTNFTPSPTAKNVFTYHIQYIDGVPVAKTKLDYLWLTVFSSQTPANPRETRFLPARISVVKIEFQD